MNGKLIRQAVVVTSLAFAGTALLIQAVVGGKSIAESIAESLKNGVTK